MTFNSDIIDDIVRMIKKTEQDLQFMKDRLDLLKSELENKEKPIEYLKGDWVNPIQPGWPYNVPWWTTNHQKYTLNDYPNYNLKPDIKYGTIHNDINPNTKAEN